MPENATDAAAGYVDAVKWIVGLSGAALAGVFLHPEQLPQHPPWIKFVVALVVILFVVNVVAGAGYLVWINRVRRIKERLKEIEDELLATITECDPEALADENNALTKELKGAPKEMQSWYLLLTGSWCVAALIVALLLCVTIVSPGKTGEIVRAPVGDPLSYTITQSAVHRTKNGRQAHTFLLNQQTGEIWQMICDPRGTVTAFRRVPRLDLNGDAEKDESRKKPSP
jgi:hypothetical protein